MLSPADFGFVIANASTGGNDVLDGGAGNDTLVGDVFFAHLEDETGGLQQSQGGNDRLIGGDGNDTLYGDADLAFGGAGRRRHASRRQW